MNNKKVEEIILERLKQIKNNEYFYFEKLRENQKINLDHLIINDLPFTSKDDLLNNDLSHLIACTQDEVLRVQASSGLRGISKYSFYTHSDIESWAECVAQCLERIGIGSSDIVQINFSYGTFTGGLGLHYGAERIGAAVIPASTVTANKQIEYMINLQPTIMASTPSYAMYLFDLIKKKGLLNKIKIKKLIL